MFRNAPRVQSATPTPRKESLFDRIRRRVSHGKQPKTPRSQNIGLSGSQHLSRSTGTLVRVEDFDDHHSVNTSSLESDVPPPISHRSYQKPHHLSAQNLTSEEVRNHLANSQRNAVSASLDPFLESERKRLVHLLSTQGVVLLQSLDTAMKRIESENATLKQENKSLKDKLRKNHMYNKASAVGDSSPGKMSQLILMQQQLNQSARLLEEKIEQSVSLGLQINHLVSQNNELSNELKTAITEKKAASEEIKSLKHQVAEIRRSKKISSDEEFFTLQNKLADVEREKDGIEKQLQRELKDTKEEAGRLINELSKANALLSESRNENRLLAAKYEALVLQQADLTRNHKIQTTAYQELQRRVSEMAEDQVANDGILQATIQMAKKADKERKKIYGVVENTGKIYETYFAEFESDAQTLRAKLKTARTNLLRNKSVYEKLLSEERTKSVNALNAKNEEITYLRALLGNRDADMAKTYGRYSAASELLGMTLLMQPSKTNTGFV